MAFYCNVFRVVLHYGNVEVHSRTICPVARTYVFLITGLLFGFLSDLIFLAGGYKNKKLLITGYSVFSLWLLGMLGSFWIMRDVYEKMMLDSIGIDYTRVVLDLFEKIVWAGHGVFLA